MFKSNTVNACLAASVAGLLVGCENLPGDKGTQGAVMGGAGGATVGAVLGGTENRALGALLGGVLGAAGGYVIGANSDRILGRDRDSAEAAARRSQEQPATAQDALQATTADLNSDGFVTLDEVVAMRSAGLTEDQMLDRMRATNQVFELTADQRQYLYDRGVSRYVVDQMENLNKETRDRLLSTTGTRGTVTPPPDATSTLPPVTTPPVIGQPPGTTTIPPR